MQPVDTVDTVDIPCTHGRTDKHSNRLSQRDGYRYQNTKAEIDVDVDIDTVSRKHTHRDTEEYRQTHR